MGRTIAKHFFHPKEVNEKKDKKDEINLANWNDNNLPFYYGQIPIYLNKVYRSIEINLEKECCSIIPDKQCLPQIVVLDSYLQKVKEHILESKLYGSVKYDLKYNELPELMNLIKSSKYFMYYLHTPKKNDGIWFAEGRFFTLEEIEKTPDEKILNKIMEFVKNKNIDYMDFLEEWVGLIFHLIAEFLLFKQKVKIIFYSCDKCYRPGIFIKEKIIKEEDEDINKIWGTINIVDTIIYNCTNSENKLNFSKICKTKQRSKNNIIYHDESFVKRYDEVSKDCDIFKNETDGAFILTTNEIIFESLIQEIKSKSSSINQNFKFDLIVTGSTAEKIFKKINNLEADKFIDRVCIYSILIKKYRNLMDKYDKIEGIYNRASQVINFINSNKEASVIYPTINLITYKEYIDKNQILHKLISSHYGQNNDNSFKTAISYLKDYLLWYPQLKVAQSGLKEIKIETLLETLQKFQGINDNETNIIKLYTKEYDSYYKDFNYWLNSSDPLAIQKTSWFIAAVINSLNNYGIKKGLTETSTLYRGVKSNLSDLLVYERAKGKLICFPSFTSTTIIKTVAIDFSKRKNPEQYETIIIIDYIYKNGFIPTAVDISEISEFKHEKECLFPPYSFFKVKNTEIDYKLKTAKIELETVGRKEILEKYLKDESTLVYKEEGFMDIEPN